MVTQIFALLATITLILVAIFQILLICGLPLGEYAWGGTHKVLPRRLRGSSIFSMSIYIFAISIILDKANIIKVFQGSLIHDYGIWGLTTFFGVGIVLNSISKSKKERMVMTPVVILLTLCCFVIGLTS